MSVAARGTQDEAPQLDDQQIREVLALTRDADSVELKLTVPEEHGHSAVAALELDPLDAYIRQVFFFDTRDLALNAAGIVARARRSQGRPDDSVVKLRPVVPAELDPSLRSAEDFVVEVDAMPGGYVCSASFKGRMKKPRVREIAAAGGPLRKLFSKRQREFFEAHAPIGVGLEDLSVLGPVVVFKLKQPAAELGRKLTVELWNYPDGSRILELSTKCAPGEGFQVAAELQAFLTRKGIDLSGEQQTKTLTALRYFAGR
jgi:hypothetical protein